MAKTRLLKSRKIAKPRKRVSKGVKKKVEWTPARKKSFIISVLRGGTRRFPPKYECLAEACVGKKINKKSGREAKHYKCAECKQEFPASDVAVDHIKAVVGVVGFTTWDSFIENLFCEKENLQVLCDSCHAIKSKKEQEARKAKTKE